MSEQPGVNRRKFIRAGLWSTTLLAAGAAAGWLASRRKVLFAGARKPERALDARFKYDLSELKKTDPALLMCKPAGDILLDFGKVRRLLVGRDDRLIVGGDTTVKVLESNGTVRSTINLSRPPLCLAAGADDRLYVGSTNQVEVFDTEGKSVKKWEKLGEKTYLTSIAVAGEWVFLADAGNREVIRCAANGDVAGRFGKKSDNADAPGFFIPSPYFDLAVGKDGLLRVANTGRHRIETYALDGQYKSAWGKASYGIDGFCGCCNPVYFKIMSDGRFVTSEKGLTRVKIYDADGVFKGVVAGPEQLMDESDLAVMAPDDCRVGCGFDVAVDSKGTILVLDPQQRRIRLFNPIA